MTTVEEIERAVERLARMSLRVFAPGSRHSMPGVFGGIIEQDARAGILAVLAEEVVSAPEAAGSHKL